MQIDDKASFINFVYPFLYDPRDFAERLTLVAGAEWPGRDRPIPLWKRKSFPTEDLLAHVGRFLNADETAEATAGIFELDGPALQSNHGLGAGCQWTMTSSRSAVPFRFDGGQLALFRIGVGFLTVRVRPCSREPGQWLDLLHFFRFAGGQRNVALRALRRKGKEETEPFFPPPAGGLGAHPEGSGTLMELLQALLAGAKLASEAGPWWREVFVSRQMLAFASLFADDVSGEQCRDLIYRARNFFDSQREIHPSADDLREDHPSMLAYADRQWFLFSLEGGAFVACDAARTDFFRNQLPNHLDGPYFLLFLLASHQRFALMKLYEEVAQSWFSAEAEGGEDVRERAFARIRDSLLAFTARGHFVQVMQLEHHHRCYRKWQETLEIGRLYAEVSREVSDMHEFLQMTRSARLQRLAEDQKLRQEEAARAEAARERAATERMSRLERRLSRLGVYIGVPALLMSFLSINLQGVTAANEGLALWQAVVVCWGGGGLVAWAVVRALAGEE